MLWVPCISDPEMSTSDPDLIDVSYKFMVNNVYQSHHACFKAAQTPARLKLEINSSYGVRAGNDDVLVTSTLDQKVEKRDVKATCRDAVQGGNQDSVVIELRVDHEGTDHQSIECRVPSVVVP